MKENKKTTYYVIYSPSTCLMALMNNLQVPEFMLSGYYISALPIEYWGIKFKGTYCECSVIASALSHINYN